MTEVERIRPSDVKKKAAPLLVCSYEDESKCDKIKIDGSISLDTFRARLPDIPKDELIVFF